MDNPNSSLLHNHFCSHTTTAVIMCSLSPHLGLQTHPPLPASPAMDDSLRRRRRGSQYRRRSWCCSFSVPPSSPENIKTFNKKPDSMPKPGTNSVPSSPLSSKSSLNLVNRMDPRRILSPGRVSPIDSDPTAESIQEISQNRSPPASSRVARSRSSSFRAPNESSSSNLSGPDSGDGDLFDVRLNLKGKHGGCLVLEMNSRVLCANSEVFSGLIEEFNNNSNNNSNNSKSNGIGLLEKKKKKNVCRLEVPEVENLGVFRETIELMFEENITNKLSKIGVYRSIDILEVSLPLFHCFCFLCL